MKNMNMNDSKKEKISILIKNIDDIEECILCSNFELMKQYVEIFLSSYAKCLLDIIALDNEISRSEKEIDQRNNEVSENRTAYWTQETNEILNMVKSGDAFEIMDLICYQIRKELERLINN